MRPLTPAQALFCLVVSGFVVYEVFTEWGVTKDLLFWAPTRLGQMVGASGAWGSGAVKSMTLFVALPAVFWLLPFGALLKTARGILDQTVPLASLHFWREPTITILGLGWMGAAFLNQGRVFDLPIRLRTASSQSAGLAASPCS